MKNIQFKWFLLILFSLVFFQPFTTNGIIHSDNKLQAPVFVDRQKFTLFWKNDVEIKHFFLKYKKIYSDQSVELFFKFGTNRKPFSINNEVNEIGLQNFSKMFCIYRWKFEKWKKFNSSVQNIRVTIQTVGDQNYVLLTIDVVDQYSLKNKVLNYKTVYSERKDFK